MTTSSLEYPLTERRNHSLAAMAARLRRESLIATAEAGSGHPTSCLSCADLLAVLFFEFLKFDVAHPDHPWNDRFILSKGHAAPILWAALAESGAFAPEELTSLRAIDSELEGHPTPRSRWVDVATGSLGQGLSAGLGMALASRMDGIANCIYVLLGDGETAEGAVWEAAALAGHYDVDNLVAIIDVNRLGQTGETMLDYDLQTYADRFAAFGWHTQIIDGHHVPAISNAYRAAAEEPGPPSVIIAHTFKGRGVSFLENENGHHGKPVTGEKLDRALAEIGEPEIEESLTLRPPEVDYHSVSMAGHGSGTMPPPEDHNGEPLATRKAYGRALAKLGTADGRIVALDGEVSNSTYSQKFAGAHPGRFVECFIAEQNMVGVALGMSVLGKVPFVSTFAAFFTRAFDQIRMAGVSRGNVKFCGSHAGISIGEDGPSQMGLEDLALFRTLPGSVVFYPCDAVSTERLVPLAAAYDGIVYLRTTRPATPVLYTSDDEFQIGGSCTLRSSSDDRATIVAAGITVFQALKAADMLAEADIPVRIIDAYSIKPIDEDTLRRAAAETDAIVTVEDHYPEGGLGDAVLSALSDSMVSIRKLAVSGMPRSGDRDALMEKFGIGARHIAAAVKQLLDR